MANIMKRYGIIGNPLHHSLSPRIHQLFAAQFNQPLTYELFLTTPDQLHATIKKFQQQNGEGLNVTQPFKQSIMELVDHCSERATIAGAINTLRFHSDGTLQGDNTDGAGLLRDLQQQNVTLKEKNILILGAGGAVRGVLHPIMQQTPARIVIANRTIEKAISLAEACASFGKIEVCSFAQLSKSTFDVVINGTSASLQQIELPLPDTLLAPHAFCYDMVYSNDDTVFLAWAKKHGAEKKSDGMGMLVEQAAESFYLWHGKQPDTQAVLQVLRKGELHARHEKFVG